MLRKVFLEQHGIASLADNRTSGVRERSGARWLLPGDQSAAVDEGGERMAVEARALSVNNCCLLAVFSDCASSRDGFSSVPIKRLVEQEIKLDVGTRFPVFFFSVAKVLNPMPTFCDVR